MQWDDKEHGGFTTGTPWLSINPNYHEINVDATLADPDSIFYMYQKLIRLRKENPLLVLGDFEVITSPTNVFCYTRRYQGEEWLIVANFSAAPVAFELPKRYSEVIISNYAISVQMKMKLRPYEAFVLR